MKKTTTKKTSPAKAASAAPAKAPAKKAAAASAARRKAVPTEPPPTFISARVNIGFGNHLYLRGEGPGLSWDHGVAMDCVAADCWAYTVKGATSPVIFKLVLNDAKWCAGNDYVVEPGQSVTVTPTF